MIALAGLAQQLVEARQRADATADTLRRAQEDAQGVLQLSTQVGRQTRVSDVLREVVEGATRAMRADRGGLSLYDEHDNVLRIQEYLPRDVWERSRKKEFSADPNVSLSGRVYESQKYLLSPDVQVEEGAQPMGPEVHGIVLAPLSVGEKRLGVLWVDSDRKEAFNDADGARLELFAAYTAIAIQNARTLEERDEFMELMTHQIVAPLSAIRGLANRLAQRLAGRVGSREARLAQRLDAHSGIAVNVGLKFANVFRLLRGEVKSVTRTAHSLHLLVGAQVALYRPLAQDRGLELVVHESGLSKLPLVPVDRDLMRHLLTVLLDNAIKYSVDKSTIELSAQLVDEDWVELSVINRGLAIGREDRKRVFQYGFRTDAAKAVAPGGTGIGLTIAAKVVDLHGGAIDVTSERDGNAFRNCFTVRLPLR